MKSFRFYELQKDIFKKMIFYLFGLFFLFSISNHFTVYAADTMIDDVVVDDFTYSINHTKKTATIKSYSGSATNVQIPENVTYQYDDETNTAAVNTLGIKAFFENSTLESVSGPSITKIETSQSRKDSTGTTVYDGVFTNCTLLSAVDFPNVVYVGKHAFSECSQLRTVNLPKASFIGAHLFRNCTNLGDVSETDGLKTITLPKATYIDENAFYYSGVQSIILPEASYIAQKAFSECTSLTNVSAPKLTHCSTKIFQNLNSDITFTVPTILKNLDWDSYFDKTKNNHTVTIDWINTNFDPIIGTIKDSSKLESKIAECITNLQLENGEKFNGSEYNPSDKDISFYPVEEGKGKVYYPVRFTTKDSTSENFIDVVYLIECYTVSTSVTNTEFTYDGYAKIPTVTVVDDGTTLTENVDYEIICSDNINAGDKTLTVKFLNDYSNLSDEIYEFKILKADIPPFKINLNNTQYYTGYRIPLILSIDNGEYFERADSPCLYLRVADRIGDYPSSSNPWIRYVNSYTLKDNKLARLNAGTYYIYYYVDSGDNYNGTDGYLVT